LLEAEALANEKERKEPLMTWERSSQELITGQNEDDDDH